MQERLCFKGQIVSGAGTHKKMEFPEKKSLSGAPTDWPDTLHLGSLNIWVKEFPDGFREPTGHNGGLYDLDDGNFEPEFVIPGALISNNDLRIGDKPASAQVWRSQLLLTGRDDNIDCWVLRRFGSNVGHEKSGNVLEIVSAVHLRERYGLENNEAVEVCLIRGNA